MRNPVLCVLFALLWLDLPAFASELPFGADGLPYLAREATWIVVSGENVEVVPRGDAYVDLFEVSVSRQLVGEGAADRLRVAVPRLRLAEPVHGSWLASSLLFLHPPMAAEDRLFWRLEVDPEISVYPLVSGRLGALPAALDEEIELAPLVLESRAADSLEDQLRLIDRLLDVDDAYLQRSAVLELMETGTSLRDQQILERIERVLGDSGLEFEARATGLQLFSMAAPLNAAQTLRDLAGDLAAPSRLRHQAAAALLGVEGGVEELRKCSYGTDVVLTTSCREVLLLQEVPPARPVDIQKLGAGALGDDDLERLSVYFESENVPADQKLELLREIQRLGDRAGAVGLLVVGTSSEVPAALRAQALEALRAYPEELRASVFEGLEAEAASHGPEPETAGERPAQPEAGAGFNGASRDVEGDPSDEFLKALRDAESGTSQDDQGPPTDPPPEGGRR